MLEDMSFSVYTYFNKFFIEKSDKNKQKRIELKYEKS
jgi:hypothetical protein